MRRYNRLIGIVIAIFLATSGYLIRKKNWVIPYSKVSAELRMSELHDDVKRGFGFREVTRNLGIDFVSSRPELDPKVMHRIDQVTIGAGVSVADVNGDGLMDVFVLSANPKVKNKLYLNQGGGRFIDVAAEWGVADNPSEFSGSSATFFDYDNDGKPDLFVAGLGCSRLYHNTGNHFVEVKDSGVTDCRNSTAGIPIDFNGDGKTDLYILRYWGDYNLFHVTDPKIYVNNIANATNGGGNTVYRNEGDGKFKEVTSEVGGGDTHWSFDATYANFGGEIGTLMYIANDYGPDTLYQIKNGKFIDISKKAFANPDRRYGMNASLLDNGSGHPLFYVSNGFLGPPYDISGNFVWDFATFPGHEVSFEKNLFNCGWAWGGAPGDFNLDGKEDLYVANGFMSNAPRGFSKSIPRGDLIHFLDMSVRTLPGVLSSDITKWPKTIDANVSAYERDCLFMNIGEKGFWNFSEHYGIDPEDRDGRSPAMIDWDNSGALDLVVSYRVGPLIALKNTVTPGRHWIGFKLKGIRSNADGTGARVEVIQEERKQYRWNTGGHSGLLTFSDPRIHFGLQSEEAVHVLISWPSGIQQEINSLQPGRYYDVVEEVKP